MGVPISSLPLADALTGAEQYPIVQNGTTKRTTLNASGVAYDPAGTGAVTTTVQSKLRETVSVKDFGADPAASASVNTVAIQAAADYAYSSGAHLQGVTGTYTVNGPINLKCNGDLSSMIINAAGASLTGPVILVGTTSGTETAGIELKLPKVYNTSKSPSTWTGAGSYPGVEFANLYQSNITLNYIYGFAVGADFGGYNSGCALNTFKQTSYLQNNKIGFRLKPKSVDGWCNENLFVGVNARIDSDHGTGVFGARNIQILPYDLTNSGNSWPNNNVFLKPCAEGDAPEIHIEIAGADNLIISPRTETLTQAQKIQFTGHATVSKTTRNMVLGGYQSSSINFSSTGVTVGNSQASPSANAYDTGSASALFARANQGSSDLPVDLVFPAGVSPLGKQDSATDWNYKLTAFNLRGKASADSYEKIKLNFTGGLVYLGDGTATPTKYVDGTSSGIRFAASVYPSADNTYAFGAGSLRWTAIYATNGTIQTSDARAKQDVERASEAEKAVALKIKDLFRKFRFVDAVQSKGNKARIHFGVIAQEVKSAFEAEDLNADDYGMFCYDEWEAEPAKLDDDGNVISPEIKAGNRFGIRYDELLAFVIAAL